MEHDNLKSLYSWFDITRNDIIKGHEGERVLLSNNAVLGYYPDKQAALIAAKSKGLQLGEFLIQKCISKEEEMVYVYTPGIFFNEARCLNSSAEATLM